MNYTEEDEKRLEEQVARNARCAILLAKIAAGSSAIEVVKERVGELSRPQGQGSTSNPSSSRSSRSSDSVQSSINPLNLTNEIDVAEDTPPVAKRQKQQNLFASFGMSASITNKAGVTKIYTPGVVDDVSVAFKCDKCMEVLFSNSNLQRLRVNSCKGLQPVNKVGALKVGRSENKGSSARRSYTHREKMAAVLHYNTFSSGTSGNAVAKMYCTTTGLTECTVSDWLRTPTSRAKIVREQKEPSTGRKD